jgi:hypothetical protein
LCLAVIAIGLLPGAGEARAQFFGGFGGYGGYGGYGSGLGAGSTVPGDIFRGEGVLLMGLGQYNIATATAASINTDTLIRWNQYVYLSLEEDLRKKYLSRMARQAHDNGAHRKLMQRLREQPDLADLRNGDALNMVLVQLIDPRVSPSNYRGTIVPLSGDTIRKIPFQYAPRAATFSMERLIGKREWPLSMRGEAFAASRRAYEKAVDAAIDQDVEGKLTGDAVQAIEAAVDELRAEVERTIPQSSRDDYNQARNHVKRLAEAPRFLRERAVERAIAEIETYPGTSVGDLLQFMQKHNLRFGVAETPQETELYARLFASLREQRDRMSLPPEPPVEASVP